MTKPDTQTWAEYIWLELFALFDFSEQSGRFQKENDAKTGLEEQAQQSSFPHPLKKKAFSPWCRESFSQVDRDSVTPDEMNCIIWWILSSIKVHLSL